MSVSSAQAVNAKCRAMYARLLNRADYDTLLSKRSVLAIAEYLKKETPYAYVLRRVNENNAHRGELEQVFKKSLFYDYERLLSFSTGDYKAGIRVMFEAYEIDDLKLVIGSICSDHERYLTPDDLTYVRHYSAFPTSALLLANTMAELCDNLKDTRYYRVLLPFASRGEPDFLRIDHALNLLNYRSKMTVFKKALSGAGKDVAVSLYGAQIDLENILFVYRIKKLYRFATADILSNLVPCYYRIGSRELLELAECDDLSKLIDLIGRTRYGFLFPKGRERDWETLHAEHFYRIHRQNLRQHGGDIGVALSYLYLKETDIKNIIMIIEGVRYALPTREIASFLIGYGGGARGAVPA